MIVTSRKLNSSPPISAVNSNLRWRPLKIFKIFLTELEGIAIAISSTYLK